MQPPRSKPRSGRRIFWIFVLVALVGAVGIGFRLRNSWALKRETEDNAVLQVTVVTPAQGPETEDLVLPGNVEAWHQATIFARTSGYLKQWYTPMGTHVHAGDLLATIETPEIDAQLRQAEADLKTAEANDQLAQITAGRWKALLKTDSVSKQETDEKIGDAMAKAAALASAKASRDHLRDLSSFKQVRAPFDGVVSARLTDVGMLINAGSEQMQQPLFRMVQSDKLRIYVKVPQNEAARTVEGTPGEVHFDDRPGEAFPGLLIKTADAIDPVSRTLLVEYVLDNKDGKLFAGGYAQVDIKLPAAGGALHLPVNTLIFRAGGLQVAVVDDQSRVALRNIVMGRDFGNEVEVVSGITAKDRVIINPPDSLASNEQVKAVEQQKKPDTTAARAQPQDDQDKDDKDKDDSDKKPGDSAIAKPNGTPKDKSQ